MTRNILQSQFATQGVYPETQCSPLVKSTNSLPLDRGTNIPGDFLRRFAGLSPASSVRSITTFSLPVVRRRFRSLTSFRSPSSSFLIVPFVSGDSSCECKMRNYSLIVQSHFGILTYLQHTLQNCVQSSSLFPCQTSVWCLWSGFWLGSSWNDQQRFQSL
jgi:hypothetical protein